MERLRERSRTEEKAEQIGNLLKKMIGVEDNTERESTGERERTIIESRRRRRRVRLKLRY